jgi:hypothetical protein
LNYRFSWGSPWSLRIGLAMRLAQAAGRVEGFAMRQLPTRNQQALLSLIATIRPGQP